MLVNTVGGQTIDGDLHHLPALPIDDADGAALKAWLASGSGHMARIAGSTLTCSRRTPTSRGPPAPEAPISRRMSSSPI